MPVSASSRKTGLIARIIDSNQNSWEDFTGTDINIPVVYGQSELLEPFIYEQGHWSYRGQASMVKLDNGNIVRARIGNGISLSDRTVYRQIITDASDQSQWNIWTQVYTGDHYAIALLADTSAPNDYWIFTAKANGIYRENVQIDSVLVDAVKIKPHGLTHLVDLSIKTVSQDGDTDRLETWYYLTDAEGVPSSRFKDRVDYRFYHQDLLTLAGAVGWYRFRAHPWFRSGLAETTEGVVAGGDPRGKYASDSLTVEWVAEDPLNDQELFVLDHNIRFLRGPSGHAGFKRINDMWVGVFGGYYYLFYSEQHADVNGNVLSNLKNPLFWSRSSGFPYYLTEAMPVGFTVWGFAGVVESNGYLYLAGNGRVLRRPVEPTELDITDYVLEGSYDLPRDNGKGTGRLICANPGNVLGAQLGMTAENDSTHTQRRIEFGIGLKRDSDDDYSFKRDADWWISNLRKMKDQTGQEHLEIELGDFWHRLENPFRDTWDFPGQFTWTDWQPEARNQLYNYSNDSDEFTSYSPNGVDADSIPRLRTIAEGEGPLGGTITLFKMKLFENVRVKFRNWSTSCGIVFRYINADNFYLYEITSTTAYIARIKDGVRTNLHSAGHSYGNPVGLWIELNVRWRHVQAMIHSTEVFDVDMVSPELWPGFVGLYAPTLIEGSNFTAEEYNDKMTTQEVIRHLLAYINEHDVELEIDEDTAAAEVLELEWGPQSDVTTPEQALREILEASKLNIVYREDA